MKNQQVTFWSSVEYASFMQGLITALRDQGIKANHRYHVSAESYRCACSWSARVWMRFRMYVTYPLMLVWHALVNRSPGIWVVCTNTFYAPLLATIFYRGKNRKVVHLLYDLFPEVLELAGKIKKNGWISRICRQITQATFRRSDVSVVLGKHLMQYVLSHYGQNSSPLKIIPVGASFEGLKEPEISQGKSQDAVTLLYCGNMGYMHEVQTLIHALQPWLKNNLGKINFKFHSSGNGYTNLKNHFKSFSHTDLEFYGRLPEDTWWRVMTTSEVGLVTMRLGSENVLMPSKTYSALLAGQAILAICPENSDLAELVKQYNLGWWVKPGDIEALQKVLDEIICKPDELYRKRHQAFTIGREQFDVAIISKQWVELLKGL